MTWSDKKRPHSPSQRFCQVAKTICLYPEFFSEKKDTVRVTRLVKLACITSISLPSAREMSEKLGRHVEAQCMKVNKMWEEGRGAPPSSCFVLFLFLICLLVTYLLSFSFLSRLLRRVGQPRCLFLLPANIS